LSRILENGWLNKKIVGILSEYNANITLFDPIQNIDLLNIYCVSLEEYGKK
jgi:hypothetical protein